MYYIDYIECVIVCTRNDLIIYILELENSTQNENVMEGNVLQKEPTGKVSKVYEDLFKVIILLGRFLP